jgi:polyisoprenoid-binding protein YceI
VRAPCGILDLRRPPAGSFVDSKIIAQMLECREGLITGPGSRGGKNSQLKEEKLVMVKIVGCLALLSLALGMTEGLAVAQSNVNANPRLAPSGRYRVVRDHTQIVFSIMHLGLSPYFGRFAGATGTLNFNALDPGRSNVAIEIDPKTASTLTDLLSRQLCGEDLFNCAKFPKLGFKSTAITKTSENTGDIVGNLTLAGVTKPVTLHATFHGGMQGPLGQDNYQLGFSAETTLKRSDFGLTKMIWTPTVSDEVKLMIAAEFEQDKS